MRTKIHGLPGALASWAVLAVGLLCFELILFGQPIPGRRETNIITYHENLLKRFKAGDTNLPLLRMDSFMGSIHSCSVEKSGRVVPSWSNGISNSTDWNYKPLNATNLQMLVSTMNSLPPSSPEPITLQRQVHISGLRSNHYFHVVYNYNRLPEEAQRLYKIIGLSCPEPESDSVVPKN